MKRIAVQMVSGANPFKYAKAFATTAAFQKQIDAQNAAYLAALGK